MFENDSKCRIGTFHLLAFFINFCPIKSDLFDRKLQVFKNSPKLTFFVIFIELLPTQNVNVACFAHSVEWDFFVIFKLRWHILILIIKNICLCVCLFVPPFACNSGPTWPILMKLSWCNERKIFVKISRKSRENEDGESVSNFPFSFGEPVVQFRYKSFFRQQQLNIEKSSKFQSVRLRRWITSRKIT